MSEPALCDKHFSRVGNYFDSALAYKYDLREDDCLVCHHVILIEEARRYIVQFERVSLPHTLNSQDLPTLDRLDASA